MRNTLAAAIVLISGGPVFGQQVIQQPVVSTSSVSTTISVPDRGSIFLGGVSSAQSARAQYGPLRSGTFRGAARSATSISTSVYVHDLHAMDEALLNSATTESETVSRPVKRERAVENVREVVAAPAPSMADKAAKFEQLAQRAEDAGKSSVAKLHWQAAARHGSKRAETRLAKLSQLTSLPTAR